jgi:hypothetical protein
MEMASKTNRRSVGARLLRIGGVVMDIWWDDAAKS